MYLKNPVIEEYFVGLSKRKILECCDLTNGYIKEAYSEYVDVSYIDAPIYTTNTNFSKRYR